MQQTLTGACQVLNARGHTAPLSCPGSGSARVERQKITDVISGQMRTYRKTDKEK